MTKITITKELDDLWATPEQFEKMSDNEIIELCMEDTSELLDGAQWKIERGV